MSLKFAVALILFSSVAFAQEAQQRRIVRPIDNASTVRLQGTLAPRARFELDRGPVQGDMPMQRMTIVFSRGAAQQAALDQLLADQQDPSSTSYHKWLTPEEFGNRFGLAQPDVDIIAGWLRAQGFTVDEIARSRTWIAFSGIAAQVEASFHAPIHNYLVDGKMHFAPSAEVAVPDAFAGVVAAITGLHDFHPRLQSSVLHASPRVTSNLSGNHYVAPGDFGIIYNLPDYANGTFQSGNDGSGQTIGIVGQTTSQTGGVTIATITSDVATFRSVSGLPSANLTTTPVGSPTTFASGDADEANLDIQWSGAVAPNAAIIFAYSTDALNTSLPFLVNQNLASVISLSYGDCEAHYSSSEYTSIEAALSQANAQGQTVAAAAGDVGATDCDGTAQKPVTVATHGLAVDYPASSVFVTGMGGTEFTGDSTATPVNGVAPAQTYWNSSSDPNDTSASAFAHIPETAWNDTATSGNNAATGGGVSSCAKIGNNPCIGFPKPSWQTGNGVPADGHRDVPDITLASSPTHDGIIICSQGSCQTGYRRNSDQTFTVIGGTSAAAPTFAGIAALANQKMGVRQGNLNPKIYSLAATAPWAFHDITTGDNKVPCQMGTPDCPNGGSIGYTARPDYDLASGWGSIDASGFLNALAGQPAQPDFVVLPAVRVATSSLTTPASVGVTVNAIQGFNSSVALTCTVSSTLGTATCPITPPSVSVPGNTTMTIVASTDPTILGTQTGTMTIQGTSASLTHSVTLNVTINYPDFQIATTNTTETVSIGGTATDTLSLTALVGFSGSVSFSCTGTTGLTCSLNPNPATANPNAAVTSTLSISASSTASSGSITITATSGTLTHTLQIPVTVGTPDFTLTVANPVLSVASGQLITTNLTVAATGGFNSDVALTCSVPGSLGTTTCTINPSTATAGNGTSLVTITGAVLTQDRGAPLPFLHRGTGAYATFVFALGVVFTSKPKRGRNSKRALRNSIFGLFLLCVMFGALSCGGGNSGSSIGSGPTPISGNVTITGTGGGITHTATINVTVH